MTDLIDRASDREIEDRERFIGEARRAPGLLSIGECHNCGASVPVGRLFCDVDCRDDWQRRESAIVRGMGVA